MSTIRRNCFAKRIVAKVVATVSLAKVVGNIFYGETSLGLEFSLGRNKRFHSKA